MAESDAHLSTPTEAERAPAIPVLLLGSGPNQARVEAIAREQGVLIEVVIETAEAIQCCVPHRYAMAVVDLDSANDDWQQLISHFQTFSPHDRTPILLVQQDWQACTSTLRQLPGFADGVPSASIEALLPAKLAVATELLQARQETDQCLGRIDDMQTQLQEAQTELKSFTHSISHDLRNPLHAISGIARLLVRDSRNALDPDCLSLLEAMADSAEKMGEHIKGLLTLADFTRTPTHLQPLDLSQLAEQVCEHLSNLPDGKTVHWRVQPGLTAVADPDMMRTLLLQLCSNAWKFCAHRDDPHVEIGGAADTGQNPAFFVRDNGLGFDPRSARDRLFKPFQQLHADKALCGNGIGLALAKRIVQRHGGQIWADGQPDQGATITFTLKIGSDGSHSRH